MYGTKAFLLFIGALGVVAIFLAALVAEWRYSLRFKGSKGKLIGITLLVLLWASAMASVCIRKAHFHYTLWRLDASDVYSIQIGRHDFRDRAAIQDLVAALRRNRWFEVNHGGWGDSIPLIVRRRSGDYIALDVALYFREPGAIIGPANGQGLHYSPTQAFAPELPRALEKYAVKLPDCDTPHGRPCTPDKLNP
jgi:hypothetical protein